MHNSFIYYPGGKTSGSIRNIPGESDLPVLSYAGRGGGNPLHSHKRLVAGMTMVTGPPAGEL